MPTTQRPGGGGGGSVAHTKDGIISMCLGLPFRAASSTRDVGCHGLRGEATVYAEPQSHRCRCGSQYIVRCVRLRKRWTSRPCKSTPLHEPTVLRACSCSISADIKNMDATRARSPALGRVLPAEALRTIHGARPSRHKLTKEARHAAFGSRGGCSVLSSSLARQAPEAV